MIKELKKKYFKNNEPGNLNNICEECKKKNETVKQKLILTGFIICESCRTSKIVFPI